MRPEPRNGPHRHAPAGATPSLWWRITPFRGFSTPWPTGIVAGPRLRFADDIDGDPRERGSDVRDPRGASRRAAGDAAASGEPCRGELGPAPAARDAASCHATRPIDRAFWVLVSRVWSRWADVLAIVRPETVIAWHRRGFARFWTWKSRRSGRPPLTAELVALIEQMTRENPLWSRRRCTANQSCV